MPIMPNDPIAFRSQDDNETWRRIYHEAAHAVVAIRLGATVRSADVLGGKDGRVDMDKPDRGTREENALHRMIIKVASFAGEKHLPAGRTRAEWRQGAGGGMIFEDVQNGTGDWPEFCEAAREYCRAKGLNVPSVENKEEDYEPYFQIAYQEAERILSPNFDAFKEIAQRLYDKGQLEIGELREVMDEFPLT